MYTVLSVAVNDTMQVYIVYHPISAIEGSEEKGIISSGILYNIGHNKYPEEEGREEP
jgi:hypothetical protein